MKKSFTLLLVLTLLAAAGAQAQITIPTNTFNPAPGTVLQTCTDALPDSALFDSCTAGSGGPKTWDFSGKPFSSNYYVTVVSAASTPGIDSFPGANFVVRAIVSNDTSWSVDRSLPAQFSKAGSVNHSPSGTTYVVYQDANPEIVFPLAMGNHWVSNRRWTEYFNGFHNVVYDSATYMVDAWGTAKYKTKSVSCLRVVSHEHEVYQTFSAGDTLIYSYVADVYSVGFVDAGFNILVSVTHQTQVGSSVYSAVASGTFAGSPTDVKEDNRGELPSKFSLDQNYPNPFNPRTEIRLSLPHASHVRLAVYNVAGQEVKLLIDRPLSAGSYTADWDGTNQRGGQVASGVYFYRMEAAGTVDTKKMVFLK